MMTEDRKQITELNTLFGEWIERRGAVLQALALVPKGSIVPPEEFLPDGWQLVTRVIPKQTPKQVEVQD